ncbi:MAG: radical SAM protein [Candidatus Aenigmarchaeota archaeon]|nr:radical SAM protein [Candidatus Aenigmarchaeota archaeon]
MVVIRVESFGVLIWSPNFDSYFLLDPFLGIRDVEEAIKSKTGPIFQNLQTMGLSGNPRIINNPQPNRLSAPLDVYFDYTNLCNLRCPYCYNSHAKRETMPEDRIMRIFEQLALNGVMRTHLAGGEPMIYPHLFEVYLRAARDNGLNASVNSNGTLLNERTLRAVFDYGIMTLTFSLDGPKETHEKYRGVGKFDRTRAAARLAVEEKRKRGLSRPLIQYKAVHMYDTPLEVYEKLIEIGLKDGVDRIQFHNPECSVHHPRGYYRRPEVIEGYYKRLLLLKNLKEKYQNQIDIWIPWNPVVGCGDIGIPGFHGCIGGQELIAIDPEGNIKPCLMNPYNFGNLFTDADGDFARFWRENERLIEYQNFVNKVDDHCIACDIYSQCRGGRKSRIITNNRDGETFTPIELSQMEGYDPYCALDHLNIHNMKFPPKLEKRLGPFRQIYVAHSL